MLVQGPHHAIFLFSKLQLHYMDKHSSQLRQQDTLAKGHE